MQIKLKRYSLMGFLAKHRNHYYLLAGCVFLAIAIEKVQSIIGTALVGYSDITRLPVLASISFLLGWLYTEAYEKANTKPMKNRILWAPVILLFALLGFSIVVGESFIKESILLACYLLVSGGYFRLSMVKGTQNSNSVDKPDESIG